MFHRLLSKKEWKREEDKIFKMLIECKETNADVRPLCISNSPIWLTARATGLNLVPIQAINIVFPQTGTTALHEAVLTGKDEKLITTLIKKGGNPKVRL